MIDLGRTITLLGLSYLAISCPGLFGQASSVTESQPQSVCVVTRPGVRIPCPQGWNISAKEPSETELANFAVTSENHHDFSAPGRALITVYSIPDAYDSLAQWIVAYRRLNPGTVESTLTIANHDSGKVEVRCMTYASAGQTSTSYFFQIGRTPVVVEVVHRAKDPKRDDYLASARWMVEHAVRAQ